MRTGAAISFSQRKSWWFYGRDVTRYGDLPPADYAIHAVAHAGAVLSIWGWW